MPLREPVSAHLAEALSWLVAHSQTNSDALAPGSLELAEMLWLARQLPEPPRSPRRRQEALPVSSPPPGSRVSTTPSRPTARAAQA